MDRKFTKGDTIEDIQKSAQKNIKQTVKAEEPVINMITDNYI